MRLFDPQLMRLLTVLTRRQAWLSAGEVARIYRRGEKPTTARTIERWFAFLRAQGGFVYYPYPRANLMSLQDVLVRVHGLRNPAILSVMPFASAFSVEVELADGHPFVNQSYWVPATALRSFEEYWETARDLGLVERVDLFRSRNTMFLFSPFHELVTPDGKAQLEKEADNRYFEALVRRSLKEKFEVRLADKYTESPLIIPTVVEHIWGHYSSRHVWQGIQAQGEEYLRKHSTGALSKAWSKPGAALRELQQAWQGLVSDFDAYFIQPRVLFAWLSLQNATFLSFFARPESADRIVELAVKASSRSIVTALRIGVGPEGWCHVSCLLPTDQQVPVLRIVNEYHRGREPPTTSVQDREATVAMFSPTFCKVDWRLFDPSALAWRFHGETYEEQLKRLT